MRGIHAIAAFDALRISRVHSTNAASKAFFHGFKVVVDRFGPATGPLSNVPRRFAVQVSRRTLRCASVRPERVHPRETITAGVVPHPRRPIARGVR